MPHYEVRDLIARYACQ